jgi:hypothetical protein
MGIGRISGFPTGRGNGMFWRWPEGEVFESFECWREHLAVESLPGNR